MSVSPSLPNGVSITSNGSLTGAPTAFQNATTYTINVSNSGGMDSITVAFEVVAGFHYDVSSFVLDRGTSNVYEMPTVNFTAVAAWSVSPTLPAGLSIGSANGTLYGIPTANASFTTYTVQATTASTTHVRTFTLRVVEAAPDIALAGSLSAQTLVTGEAGLLAMSNSGGPIASVSITPSLPSGLSLTSNGSIVGTPSALMTGTSYTINATNEGGSDSYTFTLAVVSAFSYQATTLSLERNTSVVYLAPMVNLSGSVTWSTLPSLPQGLSIGSSNGTIWGVPTVSQSLTNYTVMATSSSSTTHTKVIQISIAELAPEVAWDLTSTTVVAVKGEPVNIDLLNSGGTITSVSIWPSLPSGLTLTSSGGISGTPTAFASATTYTVNVSNSGGTDSVTITLSVVHAFTYGVDALALNRNQSTVYLPPTVNLSGNASWSVLPSLPAGLSLGATNGTLYGTPTVNLSQTSFTIRLTTDNAVHLRTLTISVDEVAPVLAGPVAVTLIKKENASFAPTNTGGPVASFTIWPSLPAGLWLSSDGEVYGVPTGLLSATTYTVNATNSGGSDSWTFSLSIVTAIDYDTTSLSLQRGASSVLLYPNVNTTATLSWSITPNLPSGLQIGSSNGTIWGTPTQTRSSTVYTIQAASSGSVHTATMTIMVAEAAPEVSFDIVSTTQSLVKSEAASIVMLNAGGTGTTVAVSPALPSGLSLTANGSIVGTPTALSGLTTYTVWVNNTGGSSNATVTIQVVTAFSYATTEAVLQRDQSTVYYAPTVNYSGSLAWSVVPSLPAGLSIGSTNGSIYGTPTVNLSQTSFTVRLTTDNAVHLSTLTLTVLDAAPSLSGASAITLITKENATLSATNSGGPIATFSISPSLPAGLSLDSNGRIVGKPTGLLSGTTYTLNASNPGGSATWTFTLAIVTAFDYETDSLSLQRGASTVLLYPNVNSTATLSWSITPTLPSGMQIGGSNGTIWGTPTQTKSSTVYTIQAASSGSVHTTTMTLVVTETAPEVSFDVASTSQTLVIREAVTLVMLNVGGTGTTVSVSPALPSGLSLTANGSIVGTPTALRGLTTYTVWVNNTGGSSNATLSIEVVSAFGYTTTTTTLKRNLDYAFFVPTVNLSTSATWSVVPSLPAGLSIGASNGTIWGTPTANSTLTTYTVRATTSSFVHTTTLQIEVTEVAQTSRWPPRCSWSATRPCRCGSPTAAARSPPSRSAPPSPPASACRRTGASLERRPAFPPRPPTPSGRTTAVVRTA